MNQTPMKSVPATEQHERVRRAILATLLKETADMPAIEVLAVLATTLGHYIAFQDQRLYSPAMLLELIGTNIETGNARAIEGLSQAPFTGRQ